MQELSVVAKGPLPSPARQSTTTIATACLEPTNLVPPPVAPWGPGSGAPTASPSPRPLLTTASAIAAMVQMRLKAALARLSQVAQMQGLVLKANPSHQPYIASCSDARDRP